MTFLVGCWLFWWFGWAGLGLFCWDCGFGLFNAVWRRLGWVVRGLTGVSGLVAVLWFLTVGTFCETCARLGVVLVGWLGGVGCWCFLRFSVLVR